MIIIDSHVHIYDCFNLDLFFDAAFQNFQNQLEKASTVPDTANFILLLAEGASTKWFHRTLAQIKQSVAKENNLEYWRIYPTPEEHSLIAEHSEFPERKIVIVAGHQLVTQENIEVLALFCVADIDNGLNIGDTLKMIREYDAVPVIPWGAGKWLGKRGELVKEIVKTNSDQLLFLGDNGGRPKIWGEPNLFSLAEEKGIGILPGSDPLPLKDDLRRVGSFGCIIDGCSVDMDFPAQQLKKNMVSGLSELQCYGELQDNIGFLMNQVRLRFAAKRK